MAISQVVPSAASPSTLFHENLDWAAAIGRRLTKRLPPSFDKDDLVQVALIEHWRRSQMYDSSTGVPYRAYAYTAVRGAVLMSCRRKHYREATHDELVGQFVDQHPLPDQVLLAEEEERLLAGSAVYLRVMTALSRLSADDRELVRQIIAGPDAERPGQELPDTRRRLSVALRRIRQELGCARSRKQCAPPTVRR